MATAAVGQLYLEELAALKYPLSAALRTAAWMAAKYYIVSTGW
jgi:hypothetical protein